MKDCHFSTKILWFQCYEAPNVCGSERLTVLSFRICGFKILLSFCGSKVRCF